MLQKIWCVCINASKSIWLYLERCLEKLQNEAKSSEPEIHPQVMFRVKVVFLVLESRLLHAVFEKVSFQMLSDTVQSSNSRRENWFSIFSLADMAIETTWNYRVKDHIIQRTKVESLFCFFFFPPSEAGCGFFFSLVFGSWSLQRRNSVTGQKNKTIYLWPKLEMTQL